jgi:hypothetical protein
MASARRLTFSSNRSILAWQSEDADRVPRSADRSVAVGITGTEAIIMGVAKTGIDETMGTGAVAR